MLRRFHLLLAAVLLSLVALGGGASSAQGGSQGAENLVAGTGTVLGFGNPMVHVNAQSRAAGVDPRGHFWIRYPNGGVEFGGTVVCLNVVGKVAGLTGHIERVKVAGPASGFVLGNYLRIRITDSGSPGTADLVNFDPGSSSPQACTGVGRIRTGRTRSAASRERGSPSASCSLRSRPKAEVPNERSPERRRLYQTRASSKMPMTVTTRAARITTRMPRRSLVNSPAKRRSCVRVGRCTPSCRRPQTKRRHQWPAIATTLFSGE